MPIELPPGTASYSDRTPPPQKRQLLLLLGFFLGFIAVIFLSLGSLVNLLVDFIPPSVEQQLGRLTVPSFERMSRPSPAQDTLNQLLDRLEVHLPEDQRTGRDYQVLYIPDNTVNAIAIPGDRVILYQGLLNQMESENELMMVMGHELGHFANRDHLRQLGRGLLLQLLIASVLGDPGSLQAIALSGVNTVANAQFSQQQEYEADEFGLSLLRANYGHVAGSTDFFERLSKLPGTVEIPFLGTHPVSSDRVNRLKQEAKMLGMKEGVRSPLPAVLKGKG
ncbi:MAG: M48 family metallopeptidase [Oculatellaceae cyanobacterium Prado106]|jgi:Zn-dependent protease with chaperone function|nr:M48 family metallopeptidase [Oculatellaceae cyanobacterium Prado106]